MEKYTLKYPIEIDGRKIETVDIRRPKVKDMKLASKQGKRDDVELSIYLIASLCELTPKEVEELDGYDFKSISDIIGNFTQATNEN